MNRTTRAVLRYTREDLKWILPVALGLGVLGEVLGLAALSLGEPENASKIVVGVLLAITFLISTIVSIVYLANQFSLFLSFSTTRQGLVAGILLHSLRISLLQTAIAFLWGTADTLVRRALGGVFPLPWQWMPWVIWPLAVLLPVWIGLFMGGIIQRFGAKGFWCAYFVFLLGPTGISQWLHPVIDVLRPLPWQIPAAGLLLLAAGLAALSLRWIRRAAVQ
ncbi:hypothetical protein [uncultured Subdoligranulum sp.]|uniref:hypothetical protein n=1 Tax=uncultured Subdoligranulum sp. TaxID=512298 RepID=UPI0025CCFC63|nr:hypothetical protein [uncultured Subdoligranulum sp.]